MRSLIFLSLLGFSHGFNLPPACATSVQNGALYAGTDLLDAAVFVFAAYSRCTTPGESPGKEIKCAVDISETIHSLNSLANAILTVLDDCKMLNTENHECGQQASELTEAMAGLSAAISKGVEHCPRPPLPHTLPDTDPTFPVEYVAKCTAYVKDSAKSLFTAVGAITKIKEDPSDNNILYVTEVLSGLAGYLAGTVGNCDHVVQMLTKTDKDCMSDDSGVDCRASLCAEASADVVKYSSSIGIASLGVQKECGKTETSRLYSTDGATTIEASSPNLFLVALLPITAVLSFVGGRIAGKRRQTQTRIIDQELVAE